METRNRNPRVPSESRREARPDGESYTVRQEPLDGAVLTRRLSAQLRAPATLWFLLLAGLVFFFGVSRRKEEAWPLRSARRRFQVVQPVAMAPAEPALPGVRPQPLQFGLTLSRCPQRLRPEGRLTCLVSVEAPFKGRRTGLTSEPAQFGKPWPVIVS